MLILLCIVYPAPDDRMSIKERGGLQKTGLQRLNLFFLHQILKKFGSLDQYLRELVDRN